MPRLVLLLVLLAGAPATAQAALDTCLARVEPYVPGEPALPADDPVLRLDTPAGGALLYFGAGHHRDPGHPQFGAIRAAYHDFRPTLVFFEGPERPLHETVEATVRAAGEPGFVRWLAREHDVAVARLEPGPAEDFGAVARALGVEQATLFFVLREAARLRDREGVRGEALDEAVGALLARAAAMGLPTRSIDDLAGAYARHFSSPADWREAPTAWFDPGADDAETGGAFMAEANRVSSGARDRYMARVLAEAALRGERVFAVVGRSHVPKQAPALRCALE